MEIYKIKQALSGPRVSDALPVELYTKLYNSIIAVFALKGTSLTLQQVKKEAELYAKQLAIDFVDDRKYNTLRFPEIDYCFMEGTRGRLDVKTYGINYSTFAAWLDLYVNSQERKDAITSYRQDQNENTKRLAEKLPPTKEEIREYMKNSVNSEYRQFREEKNKCAKAKGVFSGQIFDFGDVKVKFLMEEKIIDRKEDLRSIFERFDKEGKEVIVEK